MRYLSVAGEGCVVEKEESTKEEDHGIKNPQKCPVDEGGPSQEGILGNISVKKKDFKNENIKINRILFAKPHCNINVTLYRPLTMYI